MAFICGIGETHQYRSSFSKMSFERSTHLFFCTIRKLFDDFGGDGYVSTPVQNDANCSTVWMNGLATCE
jgi:hypothetical protein